MSKKKYMMLKSTDEVMKIVQKFLNNKSTGKSKQAKKFDADIKVADGHFWISFDSMLKIFPMPMDFYLSDESLEICKEIEKETGIFPVREFETTE